MRLILNLRAKKVFHEILVKDIKAWSTMIKGFAINMLLEDALETFSKMEEAKVMTKKSSFRFIL